MAQRFTDAFLAATLEEPRGDLAADHFQSLPDSFDRIRSLTVHPRNWNAAVRVERAELIERWVAGTANVDPQRSCRRRTRPHLQVREKLAVN